MDVMFWVWLAVIIVTAIVEFASMEIVSIWFTLGAIIPFILAATNAVRWEVQLAIFIALSAAMIIGLRGVTKKFLLKNSNGRTNLDAYVGRQYRMLERTDFETIGRVKINDVVWSAIEEHGGTIEKDDIVEIVRVDGNKMVVRKVAKESAAETKTPHAKTAKAEKVQTVETAPVMEEAKEEAAKSVKTAPKKAKPSTKPAEQKKTSAKSTKSTNATKNSGAKGAVKTASTKKSASTKATGAKSTKKN